jgi:hypothetical protein
MPFHGRRGLPRHDRDRAGGLRPRADTARQERLAGRRLRLGEHAMAVDEDQRAAEVAAGEQERLAGQRQDQGGGVDVAVVVSGPVS